MLFLIAEKPQMKINSLKEKILHITIQFILDQTKASFQGHLGKSGIAIFVLRVT